MLVHKGRAYYFCSSHCQQQFSRTPEEYQNRVQAARITVGVMGSAELRGNEDTRILARTLGEEIAKRGLITITGACPGLPHQCALGARARGGLSVGISPALSLDEHIQRYHSPSDAFDVMIYTGSGLMGREVTNIRSSDMVIIVGGSSGTLGEFSIAYDEGKLIGVVKNSGGISDAIPTIVDRIDKDTGAELIYSSDPKALLDSLVHTYEQRHFRKPSCFCSENISQ